MNASPEAPGEPVALAGVAGLAERFDGLIVNQWGVLHDGSRPYPEALDCLERLAAAGKPVVVLSNSGRRESANVRLMEAMGFPARLFARVVRRARTRAKPWWRARTRSNAALGRRCYAFTRDGDPCVLSWSNPFAWLRVRCCPPFRPARTSSSRNGAMAYGTYGVHLFRSPMSSGLKRGDVIVFEFPPDRSIPYAKRLIGLPGDTVAYRGKSVSVNGVPLSLRPQGAYVDPKTRASVPHSSKPWTGPSIR